MLKGFSARVGILPILGWGGGDQVVQIQNFKIFAKSEFKISKFLKFRIAKCKLWGHIWKNRQV